MQCLFLYVVVLSISVPNPMVMVSSYPVSPIRPVGSHVTLTCTVHVELSPAVDVPVTVNVQLSDPAGSPLTTSSMSGSTYTSTAMVSSFGRDQSGNYTCTVTVSSMSRFFTDSSQSVAMRVTAGKVTDRIDQLNIKHSAIQTQSRCLPLS